MTPEQMKGVSVPLGPITGADPEMKQIVQQQHQHVGFHTAAIPDKKGGGKEDLCKRKIRKVKTASTSTVRKNRIVFVRRDLTSCIIVKTFY